MSASATMIEVQIGVMTHIVYLVHCINIVE